MHIDARSITVDTEIRADICIVGAGPAGITLALDLESAGLNVTLLESGSREFDQEMFTLTRGEVVDSSYFPLFEARAHAFGGSSHYWHEDAPLRARRLDPIDFERREAVPHSGWPFNSVHLEPFYERAEITCRLGSMGYDPREWADATGSPMLPIDTHAIHTTMFKFTQHIEVFRNYFDAIAESETTTLVTRAHVVEIERSSDGSSVDGLSVAGLWNTAFRVKADLYVLAAGGIENARLLLVSNPERSGDAQEHVGRYFMEHLKVITGLYVPTHRDVLDDMELYRRASTHGSLGVAVLAFSRSALEELGALNAAVYLKPSSESRSSELYKSMAILGKILRKRTAGDADVSEHLRTVARQPVAAARLLASRGGGDSTKTEMAELTFQTEQAPNPESRVSLSDSETDGLGVPAARLHWRRSDLDHRSILQLQQLIDSELRRTGQGHVERFFGEETPAAPVRGNWHLMGTTRMHDSPRSGVVDSNGKLHGVGNMYVTGGSVFPTVGYANPTLTVVALAHRLADHLRHRLESRTDVQS